MFSKKKTHYTSMILFDELGKRYDGFLQMFLETSYVATVPNPDVDT
jgi:hypothetical protein